MRACILEESYWNDPHSYVKGITTSESTATHWKLTKPKGLPSRYAQEYEIIEDIVKLNKTVNTEEHRKYHEKVRN